MLNRRLIMVIQTVLLTLLWGLVGNAYSHQDSPTPPPLRVSRAVDFQIDGTGRDPAWNKVAWMDLSVQESAGEEHKTRLKTCYSTTGIYFLFQCEDQVMTATIEEDFGPLFKEDVVEVFLQPNPALPIYFEYELSPLNYELALLIINIDGTFNGWRPSSYSGDRKVVHATSVQGGEKRSGADITGWTAEFFIPFRLLSPLVQDPPQPGTTWKANFYRIDYDQGYSSWSWQRTTPDVRGSFHEMQKFGTLIFE